MFPGIPKEFGDILAELREINALLQTLVGIQAEALEAQLHPVTDAEQAP